MSQNEQIRNRLVKFSADAYKFYAKHESKVLHTILDQFARSASSIGANVEEGNAAATIKDKAHFYQYSIKSAREVQYWLDVLKQFDVALHKEVASFESELVEFRKILAASVKTMRKR
jgi:four helix bundle protein